MSTGILIVGAKDEKEKIIYVINFSKRTEIRPIIKVTSKSLRTLSENFLSANNKKKCAVHSYSSSPSLSPSKWIVSLSVVARASVSCTCSFHQQQWKWNEDSESVAESKQCGEGVLMNINKVLSGWQRHNTRLVSTQSERGAFFHRFHFYQTIRELDGSARLAFI